MSLNNEAMQAINGKVVWTIGYTLDSAPSIATSEDDDGNTIPYLHETKAAAEASIQSDLDDLNQRILEGDADEDEVLEDFPVLAKFDNEKIHILDEDTHEVINSYNWTAGNF